MAERIQKLLATVGVASRREIERLIEEGRILVNGRPAEAGQHVSHEDHIRVDGRTIALKRKAEAARVLIYKKRTGELVTRDDPEGRRTVFRKLPRLEGGRWIAVGRLDINTSGLLLFTNHGELARRLTHPSFEVPRTYAVRVLGTVDADVIARWKAGVELDDGVARFERVEHSESEDGEGANQWFHVSVREGRNRLVRRLIESQDLQVSRLIRISYGPIELGRGNKSGTAREATPGELLALLDAVGLTEAEAGLEARKPGRGGKPPARGAGKFVPPPRGPRFYDDDDDDEDDEDDRPRRSQRGARPPSAPRGAAARAPRAGGRPQREGDSRKTRDDRPRRDETRAEKPRSRFTDEGSGKSFGKNEGHPVSARRGEDTRKARDERPRRDDARGEKPRSRSAGEAEGKRFGKSEGRPASSRRGDDARPTARGDKRFAERNAAGGARPGRDAGGSARGGDDARGKQPRFTGEGAGRSFGKGEGRPVSGSRGEGARSAPRGEKRFSDRGASGGGARPARSGGGAGRGAGGGARPAGKKNPPRTRR